MNKKLMLLVVWTLMVPMVTARYQWTSWSRPSDCSRTCGQGVSSRIRECKPTDENSHEGENDCPGAATIEEICFKPPCPLDPNKSNCNCGCLLTQSSGQLRSRLSSKDTFCHWVIKTKPGTKPVLSINQVQNFDWKNGGIYITGGSEHHKYTEQDGTRLKRDFPFVIHADGNVMNVTLHYFKKLNDSQMVKLDASYTVTKVAVIDEAKQILNFPAIIGIAACATIILIASIIAICRRMRNSSNSGEKTKDEKPQEEFEDSSSVSGSNRSYGKHYKQNNGNLSGKSSYSSPYSTGTLSQEERERLLATVNNDMYLQKEGSMVSGMPHVGYLPPGQAYVNYPVQNGQIVQPVQMIHAQSPLTIQQLPQPAINYMIQQTQLNYNRQLPYEHSITGTPYDYATSGTEG